MKIYGSSNSPFVRKCLVVAAELNIEVSTVAVASAVHPLSRDPALSALNPLAQVPTLITSHGDVLGDSRVICEYFIAQSGSQRLLSLSGASRWRVLTAASFADGMLDELVASRFEQTLLPETLRWTRWSEARKVKVETVLDWFVSKQRAHLQSFDLASISLACGLSYMLFRFPECDWRAGRAALSDWYDEVSERQSIAATRPR